MIGNNSYIGEGCTVEKSLVLGNDYYTNEKTRAASIEKGESALGVGMSPLTLSPFTESYFLQTPNQEAGNGTSGY